MLTTVITIEPWVQSEVFREMLIACQKQAAALSEWLGIVVDLNNSPTNRLIVDDIGNGKVLYLPGSLIDATKTDKDLPLTVGAAARNMAAAIVGRGRILFMDADCIPDGNCFRRHWDFGVSAHIVAGSVCRESKNGLLRDPRLSLLRPEYRDMAHLRNEQVDKIGHQYVWAEHISFPFNYFEWTGGFWEYGAHVNMGTELTRRFREGLGGGSLLCYSALGILKRKFPKRLSQADRDSQYALYASKPYYRGPHDVIQVCHNAYLPWDNSKKHPTDIIRARDRFPQKPTPDFRWDAPPKVEAPKPIISWSCTSTSSDPADGTTWVWHTIPEAAAQLDNAQHLDGQWAIRVVGAVLQGGQPQAQDPPAIQLGNQGPIVLPAGVAVMTVGQPAPLPPPVDIGNDDEEDIDDDDYEDDGDDGEWEDDDDLDDLDGGSTLDDYDDEDDDWDVWVDDDEDEQDDDY